MQTSQQLNKGKVFNRATAKQRLISGLVVFIIAAFFCLLGLVVHYKIALWPYGCGLKQAYNLPCPTCGMTTAVLTFTQGRIFEAFYIQPAGAFFCSLLVVSAFLALLTAVFGVYFQFLKRFFTEVKIRHLVLALIVIIAAGWAVTMARGLAAKY